ncbi:hypothetical protein [Marinicella litoralis]|uniref:UDP-N-acetyl-alpha-D-muramoyl-L-alanyl-L-glutamate epimerase n=1 Tax=Marinicella litoralis TaxID=644220 RepID=A0A4R6XW70_9GAMM|nr:hypothetical protein [Marinicella litoralis]TDR22680.1 hypothetical protein C8D91_1173 [Marinicella litoralis]
MTTASNHYFEFLDWQFNPDSGHLVLNYFDSQFGFFSEQFDFPAATKTRYEQIQQPLETALNCLHWMAGVSYYKTSLARQLKFSQNLPNDRQAAWLTETWQSGLAELAFENQKPWLDFIDFPSQSKPETASITGLQARSLVAIGGGKDSLVSIEMLKNLAEDISLFVVGQSTFIQSVAEKTSIPLLQVRRTVDARLKEVNEQGAFNGHVPITAINSCVAVVAALLFDYDSVVFSNERSADVGNVEDEKGRWVNHQYSKSFEFEQAWQSIIHNDIAIHLDYFSLLRPFSELAVVKKFAKLTPYFPYFSSCNRNFHLAGSRNSANHWCGECPKCAFVFLCLAPFIKKQQLLHIFNKNLLADDQLQDLFAALLGVKGQKPFECVGEERECRTAMRMLAEHTDWNDDPAVLNWVDQIAHFDPQEGDRLFQVSTPHQIPDKRNFLQALSYEFK